MKDNINQRMSVFSSSSGRMFLWRANKEGMRLQRGSSEEPVGEGSGDGRERKRERSKPKRMLSWVGMLLECDFLVGHNNIRIVLFFSQQSEKGEKGEDHEKELEGKRKCGRKKSGTIVWEVRGGGRK